MLDIIAIGELLIDFASQSADAEGYPTLAAHPGGAPANFLAAAGKYGLKTAMLGKVGNDGFLNYLLFFPQTRRGVEGAACSQDRTAVDTLDKAVFFQLRQISPDRTCTGEQ